MSDEVIVLAQPYNPWKSLWKGLRPALIVAATAAGAALVQNIEPEQVQQMGLELGAPSLLMMVAAEAFRNWKKNKDR